MKVFLSSTYLDLIEHRKAVVNALRTMGEEVDHMEIFGARDEEATKSLLKNLINAMFLLEFMLIAMEQFQKVQRLQSPNRNIFMQCQRKFQFWFLSWMKVILGRPNQWIKV